jgi:hypothetical protein
MDYAGYFRELADYYNHSRIPSKVMTGAAELRAEFNQSGSWVHQCGGACHINFMNHVPFELLPAFIEGLHRKLEPGSVVFCASQRWQGSAEEPWYEKPETGDIVSLRHHDDGRPIEVVDTLFTEELLREVLDGKAQPLQITIKPWWWWASYEV